MTTTSKAKKAIADQSEAALAQYRRDKREHDLAAKETAAPVEPLPLATHKRCTPGKR